MRRKKHKNTRRSVAFYKINYNFHEPYKVLLDGNFIHAMLSMNLTDLEDHITRLLGGKVKLYVSTCISAELKSLGSEMVTATRTARRCILHKCSHTEAPVLPSTCLHEQIADGNPGHWWVATQDAMLRRKLEACPGVPVLFATVNGVHLEEPPEMAKECVKQADALTKVVPAHEKATAALADLEELQHKNRVRTNVSYRKNRAKGPNPLSMKKKATKVHASAQKQGDGASESEKKRKRKKKKAEAAGVSAGGNEAKAE